MRRFNRIRLAVINLTCCFFLISYAPCVANEPNAVIGTLRLNNGDFIEGALAHSNDIQAIAWQHPYFESPFTFPTSSVAGATFSTPQTVKPIGGDLRLELWNGDRLAGSIVGIDEQFIQLRTIDSGDLRLPRKQIRRLTRWKNGDAVIAADCGNLKDWRFGGDRNKWMSRGGMLRSETAETWAFSDVAISERSRIDVEVSWEKKPNFVLAFGVGAIDPVTSAATAFRIEVWQDQLVAVWEFDDVADVAVIGKVSEMNNQLSLTIELDQASNHAVVLSEQGKKLAELNLDPNPLERKRPWGFWLQNILGTVSLDSLVVGPFNSIRSLEKSKDKDVFFLDGDKALSGTWTGFEDDLWLLTDGDTVHRIDPKEVVQVDFAKEDDRLKPEGEPHPSQVQLRTHSGVRLTGTIEQVSRDQVSLKPDSVEGTVSVATSDIRKLTVVGAKASTPVSIGGMNTRLLESRNLPNRRVSPPNAFPGIVARLVAPGTRLHGRLVDSVSGPIPTPINFEPVGSKATVMSPGFAARIIYEEPAVTEAIRNLKQQQVQRKEPRPAGMLGAFSRAFGNNSLTQTASQKSIYLRTGEVIPCTISQIDEKAVYFKSDMTEKTQLPTDQIRAIQLISGRSEPTIEGLKRDRLLTVPRIRKKNPPTHLVVAVNGDVMRCQLKRLTEKIIEVETRLENIEIDRSLIAQIVWLDNVIEQAVIEDKPSQSPATETQVRAMMKNGNQMTLVPQSVVNGELIGVNPLLGQCRVRLANVSELLIGDVSPTSSASLPFDTWKLSDAPEPILPDDSGGQSRGMGSPLVGTQAPDFKLALLGGGHFDLSQCRGKIVVLDFWATWCGPCMQAMPIIEDTVRQFEKDNVMLVTINLQEGKEPIQATLERLNINPTVALDIDGVAAARYQADAIPQTVVIDREGKISHLFVGGGAKLGEQLSDAIRSNLGNDKVLP